MLDAAHASPNMPTARRCGQAAEKKWKMRNSGCVQVGGKHLPVKTGSIYFFFLQPQVGGKHLPVENRQHFLSVVSAFRLSVTNCRLKTGSISSWKPKYRRILSGGLVIFNLQWSPVIAKYRRILSGGLVIFYLQWSPVIAKCPRILSGGSLPSTSRKSKLQGKTKCHPRPSLPQAIRHPATS